jgi:hypothetical protein
LKKAKHALTRNSAAQLERLARERADEQARRIPWPRLLEARNQYIDWQEFYLWVRSIVEVEGGIPVWLLPILDERCPGFLVSEQPLPAKAAKARPLALRLEDWIEANVFAFARQENWFSALQYYAIRDPRYQRAEVCWSESIESWKQTKPLRYPTFAEWKKMAAQCDPTANLLPGVRRALASSKKVAPEQLAAAVSRYIDWEAFAYWVRAALERSEPLPREVARGLEERCPGFLEFRRMTGAQPVDPWPQLMRWISDSFFREASAEGWLDAIVHAAAMHPRAIRTMEYADHCDELWGPELPQPYPSFAEWRQAADAWVDAPAAE